MACTSRETSYYEVLSLFHVINKLGTGSNSSYQGVGVEVGVRGRGWSLINRGVMQKREFPEF